MTKLKLLDTEHKLACIVWELEPIHSTELVKVCAARLGWSRSTTYTALRKLCERGLMQNDEATVRSLVGRDLIQKHEREDLK